MERKEGARGREGEERGPGWKHGSVVRASKVTRVIKFSISFSLPPLFTRGEIRVNGQDLWPRREAASNLQGEICLAGPLPKSCLISWLHRRYTVQQLCKTAILLFAPRCIVPQRCYYSLGRTKNAATTNNALPPQNCNNSSSRWVLDASDGNASIGWLALRVLFFFECVGLGCRSLRSSRNKVSKSSLNPS